MMTQRTALSTRSPRCFSDARDARGVARPPAHAPGAPGRRAPRVRVGEAAPDVWVVVSTTASREDQDKKQAIPVGSTVRFTAQYGWRAGMDDDSNMAVLRGEVVIGRTPLLPDSYTVRVTEVAKTHKLDPSVPLPFIGQVFLVAPWSVADVEPKKAASTFESYGVTNTAPAKPTPRSSEFAAPAHGGGGGDTGVSDSAVATGTGVALLTAAAIGLLILLVL